MGVTHHSSICHAVALEITAVGFPRIDRRDPARPEHSILLRVAVMVAPH